MVAPRPVPFIWVGWLAKIMAGETVCQWQYWFQARNQLINKRPPSTELVGWRVQHSRMVTELCRRLVAHGRRPQKEFRIRRELPEQGVVVTGSIDCLVVHDSQARIYECKVGQPRQSDQVQTMLYMYLLSQQSDFAGLDIRGTLVYKDSHLEIDSLPEEFGSDVEFFISVLAGDMPVDKQPGPDCRYCALTRLQCPERVDL